MRTIQCIPRGCGRKKKGKVYIVSEPGEGGLLPLWTSINPSVPYEGAQFRGTKLADLELILAGRPMNEYLIGASAERLRREALLYPEIQTFGMPLRNRLRTGICIFGGLEALNKLRPTSLRDYGLALRSLRALDLGKALTEVAAGFRNVQEQNYAGALASAWRLWINCPPSQKKTAAIWTRLAMRSLGAADDAMEVLWQG